MTKLIYIFSIILLIISCGPDQPLPFLGDNKTVDGVDVPHFISDFSFINQDSSIITNSDLAGKIYVADFFFIKCPSICPIVTRQMLRIHEAFKEDEVALVSFTMDPVRDTPPALQEYASKLEVSAPKWQFLTGNKNELHDISTDYFSIIIEDDEAPGGFNHSGYILLVDTKGHIRSYCIGTEEKEVDDLIKDIKKLLAENEK